MKKMTIEDKSISAALQRLHSEIEYPSKIFASHFDHYYFGPQDYVYDWAFVSEIAEIHKSSEIGFSCLFPDPVSYWRARCGHEASFFIGRSADNDLWDSTLDGCDGDLSCSLRIVAQKFIVWGDTSWMIYCDTSDDLIVFGSNIAEISTRLSKRRLYDVAWANIYWRSKKFEYSEENLQKALDQYDSFRDKGF